MNYNPPNTRERVAARRQLRRTRQRPADGAQASPGPRRLLLAWLANGKLAALLLLLAAAGGLAYSLSSPRFAIGQVLVEGNQALSAEAVAELSGLEGLPIWFAPTERAVERLVQNAYVETASVELALPNTALVRIAERRPELRWVAGGVAYLVDSQGIVLGPAQEAAEADVLVITDSSRTQLAPNDQVDVDALALARDLAVRLPADLGFTPAQIGWDYGLGVYVRSAAGQLIVFGRSEQLDRKLAVLRFLLGDGTAFTYLDLRPSNPFYQNTAPEEPEATTAP